MVVAWMMNVVVVLLFINFLFCDCVCVYIIYSAFYIVLPTFPLDFLSVHVEGVKSITN